jgi:Family of unknown function (DUF5681)
MNGNQVLPGHKTSRSEGLGGSVDEGGADADNRVGYRRPPKHSRFQPGQSGNPGGRPLGVKSLSDIVRKIVGQKSR